MKTAFFSLCFCLFLMVSASLSAHAATANANITDDAAYLAAVDHAIQAKGENVDWPKLRDLYQDSSFYTPYGAEKIWKDMTALGAGVKTSEGQKQYLDYLRQSYAHYRAQMNALVLSEQPQGAFLDHDTYAANFKNIVASILKSGDGRTPETAIHVIDTAEEYFLMRSVFHLEPAGQSLVTKDKKAYDKIDVTDDKGRTGNLYFEITKLMAQPVK